MEEIGRGLFKVLPHYLPGWTEEIHDEPESGYAVSGPRFETGSSRTHKTANNHAVCCVRVFICVTPCC